MSANKQWFVYVLINQNGDCYTGVTLDDTPDRRLAEHNGERPGGAKYTRTRGPWEILYVENGSQKEEKLNPEKPKSKNDRKFKSLLKLHRV